MEVTEDREKANSSGELESRIKVHRAAIKQQEDV
jgi:hypothetical protein